MSRPRIPPRDSRWEGSPQRRKRPSRPRSPRRRLPRPDDTDAYGLALKALGRKERTEAQLAEWLRERGVDEDELAEVMARVHGAGLLDDEGYAIQYAADKRELRGWGPDRIREALRQRGVAEDLIEKAIGDEDSDQQVERAVGLLAERELDCDSDAGRGKALQLLVRRGFPLEIGYAAVRSRESRAA